MRWLPRTLFARTFLLTAGLVLLTTLAWLAVFNYYETEPRARQTAELASSAVNTVRAALIAADPARRPALFNDLSQREGIRLLPADPTDRLEALPSARYWQLLEDEILLQLGPATRVAYAVDGIPGLWVSFRFDDNLEPGDDDEEFWVMLPRERASPELAMGWLLWGAIASVLSLGFATYLAARLTGPLKIMAAAARSLGQGQRPTPIPESGPAELQQLATTFNRMAADLAAHEAERAEVLAGISHDLRTPLTRLRLEAEMSIADDAARQAAVADIEQMESVITQFLDYARGDGGETPCASDVHALLSALVERQARLGREIHAEISELPLCEIRPKALQRAVANLLENAYKYGAPPVALHAWVDGTILYVEVMDRGSGIPASEAERMKRPFTQLEDARSEARGTGLGLAIVERVVRLHAGRFELLPREGGGLLARLRLPTAK